MLKDEQLAAIEAQWLRLDALRKAYDKADETLKACIAWPLLTLADLETLLSVINEACETRFTIISEMQKRNRRARI